MSAFIAALPLLGDLLNKVLPDAEAKAKAQLELARLAQKAGLEVLSCDVVAREKRPPHFEVVSLLAKKI